MFKVPEKYRVKTGHMASNESDGNNGMFIIRSLKLSREMLIVASDGMGWEHVSVSSPTQDPSWNDMCAIKNMFWDEGDLVVQYHPVKSEYVNHHPHCLHLWRKSGTNDFCETPHKIMVG